MHGLCEAASRRHCCRLLAVAIVTGLAVMPARALDKVVLRKENREQSVEGPVLVKAEDGGLLVMAADGTLYTVPPDELVSSKMTKNSSRWHRRNWRADCSASCPRASKFTRRSII